MAEKFSLKDHLFNHETVSLLGGHFEDAGVFKARPFIDQVMGQMAALELMDRIKMIAAVLDDHLPPDFRAAGDAIVGALPPPLDPTLQDDDFGRFIYAPLGVYVENHGLADHVDHSLDVLEAITQRFSVEFSIRAFLNAHQDKTLERMQDWVTHDHYHVRRLVSEGTRPKLPWGKAIGLTSDQTLPLLDRLHGDPTRFVTRSVANHLNDITKSDPDTVIATLARWQKAQRQDAKELDWMRRHTLRGLIKAGHSGAMMHLGYDPDVAIHVTGFEIAPTEVKRGDAVDINVTLAAQQDAPLVIDYVIDFMKANGKTAPKVFKLKVLEARAGKALSLKKRHVFKENATTFTLYPGPHRLHLQINGRIVQSLDFDLT